jgi:hypothetical protein
MALTAIMMYHSSLVLGFVFSPCHWELLHQLRLLLMNIKQVSYVSLLHALLALYFNFYSTAICVQHSDFICLLGLFNKFYSTSSLQGL